MPRIRQTKNFLEKKENRAWNSKQRIGILVERNEIITAAERRETIKERDLWEEERQWGCEERNSKGKREKVRKLTMSERRRQKIMFLMAIDEDNIYRKYNAWERDCFPKNILENNL